MRATPTIEQIYKRLESDFKKRFGLSDIDFKQNFSAISAVLAGELKIAYLYLDDIRNNLFPDTADLAVNGGELERLGFIYLNRAMKPATNGVYLIEFEVINPTLIRNGLTYISNEGSYNVGKLFISEENLTVSENSNRVKIRSLESGAESQLKKGDTLTITEPVLGVSETVEVMDVLELPLSSESVDEFREKILQAIQLEPQGGARTDYKLWSADAQGVRTVYPYVKENDSGILQVFVESKPEDSIDGFGTPSEYMIRNTEDVLNFDPDETKELYERGRKPMQCFLEVLPIELIPVDVHIVGLSSDDLNLKETIKKNVEKYLFSIRPYIAGADLPRSKNDTLYSGKIQGIVSDSLNNNNFFESLSVNVSGQNIISSVFSFSNIPYLRNLTYG